MLSFISLIYYKNLCNHVRQYVKPEVAMNNQTIPEYFGDLGGPNSSQNYEIYSEKAGRRIYKKRIVNKWHLIIFLVKNPILIIERKHNFDAFRNRVDLLIDKCLSLSIFNACNIQCNKESGENSKLIN